VTTYPAQPVHEVLDCLNLPRDLSTPATVGTLLVTSTRSSWLLSVLVVMSIFTLSHTSPQPWWWHQVAGELMQTQLSSMQHAGAPHVTTAEQVPLMPLDCAAAPIRARITWLQTWQCHCSNGPYHCHPCNLVSRATAASAMWWRLSHASS